MASSADAVDCDVGTRRDAGVVRRGRRRAGRPWCRRLRRPGRRRAGRPWCRRSRRSRRRGGRGRRSARPWRSAAAGTARHSAQALATMRRVSMVASSLVSRAECLGSEVARRRRRAGPACGPAPSVTRSSTPPCGERGAGGAPPGRPHRARGPRGRRPRRGRRSASRWCCRRWTRSATRRASSASAGASAGVPAGAIARGRLPFVSPEIACSYAVTRGARLLVLLVLQVVLGVAVHDAATGDDGGRVLGRLSECRGGNDCNGECAQDGDDAAGHVTS